MPRTSSSSSSSSSESDSSSSSSSSRSASPARKIDFSVVHAADPDVLRPLQLKPAGSTPPQTTKQSASSNPSSRPAAAPKAGYTKDGVKIDSFEFFPKRKPGSAKTKKAATGPSKGKSPITGTKPSAGNQVKPDKPLAKSRPAVPAPPASRSSPSNKAAAGGARPAERPTAPHARPSASATGKRRPAEEEAGDGSFLLSCFKSVCTNLIPSAAPGSVRHYCLALSQWRLETPGG